MGLTATLTEKRAATEAGWPARHAADGDPAALAELVDRHLGSLHGVLRFLAGDEDSTERTARAVAAATRSGSWSREDELAERLFAEAAGVDISKGSRAAELPASASAVRALALVEVAGRSPADAAGDLGVRREDLSISLVEGRVALRRAQRAISGGGRCLRARALLSLSLDEGLPDIESRMLRAHLSSCIRCPEHETVLGEELERLYERFRGPAPEEVRRAVREALGDSAVDGGGGAAKPDSVRRASEEESRGGSGSEMGTPEARATGRSEEREETDALGLPKRRQVMGHTAGPSKARQFAFFLTMVAIAFFLYLGARLAVSEFDTGPEGTPETAPWSRPGPPQVPPERPL